MSLSYNYDPRLKIHLTEKINPETQEKYQELSFKNIRIKHSGEQYDFSLALQPSVIAEKILPFARMAYRNSSGKLRTTVCNIFLEGVVALCCPGEHNMCLSQKTGIPLPSDKASITRIMFAIQGLDFFKLCHSLNENSAALMAKSKFLLNKIFINSVHLIQSQGADKEKFLKSVVKDSASLVITFLQLLSEMQKEQKIFVTTRSISKDPTNIALRYQEDLACKILPKTNPLELHRTSLKFFIEHCVSGIENFKYGFWKHTSLKQIRYFIVDTDHDSSSSSSDVMIAEPLKTRADGTLELHYANSSAPGSLASTISSLASNASPTLPNKHATMPQANQHIPNFAQIALRMSETFFALQYPIFLKPTEVSDDLQCSNELQMLMKKYLQEKFPAYQEHECSSTALLALKLFESYSASIKQPPPPGYDYDSKTSKVVRAYTELLQFLKGTLPENTSILQNQIYYDAITDMALMMACEGFELTAAHDALCNNKLPEFIEDFLHEETNRPIEQLPIKPPLSEKENYDFVKFMGLAIEKIYRELEKKKALSSSYLKINDDLLRYISSKAAMECYSIAKSTPATDARAYLWTNSRFLALTAFMFTREFKEIFLKKCGLLSCPLDDVRQVLKKVMDSIIPDASIQKKNEGLILIRSESPSTLITPSSISLPFANVLTNDQPVYESYGVKYDTDGLAAGMPQHTGPVCTANETKKRKIVILQHDQACPIANSAFLDPLFEQLHHQKSSVTTMYPILSGLLNVVTNNTQTRTAALCHELLNVADSLEADIQATVSPTSWNQEQEVCDWQSCSSANSSDALTADSLPVPTSPAINGPAYIIQEPVCLKITNQESFEQEPPVKKFKLDNTASDLLEAKSSGSSSIRRPFAC